MKKNIVIALVLMFGLSLSFYGVTEAAEIKCGNPADNNASFTYVNCGAPNPENVVNGYGITNSQAPRYKPGVSFITLSGRQDTCPYWFPMDCLDISGTAVYLNSLFR